MPKRAARTTQLKISSKNINFMLHHVSKLLPHQLDYPMQHKSLTLVNNFEDTEGNKKLQFRGFVFIQTPKQVQQSIPMCQEPHFFYPAMSFMEIPSDIQQEQCKLLQALELQFTWLQYGSEPLLLASSHEPVHCSIFSYAIAQLVWF